MPGNKANTSGKENSSAVTSLESSAIILIRVIPLSFLLQADYSLLMYILKSAHWHYTNFLCQADQGFSDIFPRVGFGIFELSETEKRK